MGKIYLITDYKDRFGSKWNDSPYRSGFNKNLLRTAFEAGGYSCEYLKFEDINRYYNKLRNEIVLYTSSEDIGFHYKEYIEDVVFFLESVGNQIIPAFKYLRANNNKVYMELIRKELGNGWNDKLKSWSFGTFEGMLDVIDKLQFPIVIKESKGAQGRQVFLAKNRDELLRKVKYVSSTKYFFNDVKDRLRTLKHKGYIKESLYRNKYILQQFIPDLTNDWKILIFGTKYYILYRGVKPGTFKASGSSYNYKFGSESTRPPGIFDFAKKVFDTLKVPFLSLDIAYDGKNFYLIEFQAVFFGTSVFVKSDVYYKKHGNVWKAIKNDDTLEQVYADSIIWFLKEK